MAKMGFETEQAFCEYVTKLILGLLVGENRNIICIPEVPRHYRSNEHVDMLLLDIKNMELMGIEYKLNSSFLKLLFQVRATTIRGLPCIGIINTKVRQEKCEERHIYRVFDYTGEDKQLERLADYLIYAKYSHWGSVYGSRMVYYWAYKNNKSKFNGGIYKGKRQMFASMYMQAIRNLHKEYGRLDFLLTHMALGNVYSVSVSKKYYNQVLKVSANG